MHHESGYFYHMVVWLFLQCFASPVLAIEEFLPPKPKETLLMDSRETNWEGWTKNTPHNIGWRQQSRPGIGYSVYGLCEPVLRIPQLPSPQPNSSHHADPQNYSVRTGDPGTRSEFWLFSPRIQLGRAISVHAQIFFMLRSCADRELTHSLLGCREHFDLYLQKGTPTEGLEWDPEVEPTLKKFKKLATISSDTKWSADTSQPDAVTSWLIRFKPMVHQSWIRLAVRDEGACLMLDRIRIYYLSCPAWQVGYMRLPETAAGHDAEVREVQGECVHGARPKGRSSNHTAEKMTGATNQITGGLRPSFCKANGRWHVLGGSVCECLSGYESSADSSTCTACPVSTYKLRAGAGVCQLCPPHSQTVTVASSLCDCDSGYFWHQQEEEGRNSGVCTQDLPTPTGLRLTMRDETKLVLTWNVLTPHAGVDISDVVYVIRCSTCRKSAVSFIPGDVINGTQVTIKGIGPEERHDIFVAACMGPISSPVGCSEEPAEIMISPNNDIVREVSRDAKIEENKKRTPVSEDQSTPTSLLTWFHILLGVAVFVCMTLLFVFLAVIFHRLARGRAKKRPNNTAISQASNSSYVKGFYNSLEQISLPVNATFHRINSIDRDAIEIDESLGEGHFGEVFRGHLLTNAAYPTTKDITLHGCGDVPVIAQAISTSSTTTSPLHQIASSTTASSSFSSVSYAGLGSSIVTSRLPIFLRSVRLSTSSPLRAVSGTVNDDEESLLLSSAHLSLHLRNPALLACYGIVKSVQPHLFVYEYMQRGRLRKFLERELREVDEALGTSKEYKSSLLSTKLLFKMLHQIVSGFEFLSKQHIPDLMLDSSSVLVGADYTCKLEIAFWRNCLRQKTRNPEGRASFYVNNLGSLRSDVVGCLEVDDRDELESQLKPVNSQRTAKISVTPFPTGALISQTSFSHLKCLENSPASKCDSNTYSTLSLFRRLARSVIRRTPPEAFTEYLNEPSHVWCYGCIQLEVLLAGALYQQRVLRASGATTDFGCPGQILGLTSATCSSFSSSIPYSAPHPQQCYELFRPTQDLLARMRHPRQQALIADDLLATQQQIACSLSTMEYDGQPRNLAELREILVVFVCDWFANDFLSYLLRGCLREDPKDRPAFSEILRHLAKYAAENAVIYRRSNCRMKSGHSTVLEQKYIPQETAIVARPSIAINTQSVFKTADEKKPDWKSLLVPELHILGEQSS